MRYNSETDMIEICFNEEWIEWQIANLLDFKIYTNGYQNIALTNSYSTNWDRSQGTVTLTASCIEFKAYANSAALIGTDTPVNLTDFSKLCFEYNTSSNSTKQIKKLDISGLSGDRYIWLSLVDYNGKVFAIGTNTTKKHETGLIEMNTNSVTYIYRVWLE